MTIKYRYALVDGGNTINIDDVSPAERKKEYTCIQCGEQLIPALGTIMQHHFRHKAQVDCSPESYLHKLAKLKLYDAYKNCLDSGLPFLINFSVVWKCNIYAHCKGHREETYDLTKYFPMIDIETPHGNFIPDILLRNANGDSLYIEIKVSHECTQEKINSGNRIIEIEINCEKDIEDLYKNKLIDSHKNRFFNFVQERLVNCCQEECNQEVAAFTVYPSGKSILFKNSRVSDIIGVMKHSIYSEWFDSERLSGFYQGQIVYDLYKKKNAEAFQKGIPVRNCYLCRYHSISYDEPGTYCKYLKRQTNSNFAAECNIFRPDIEVYREYLEYSIQVEGLVVVKNYAS